jgi:hypothetical protein
MLVAIAAAFWRKVSRKRRYALGVFATAFLGMGGAIIGGIAGDQIVGGDGLDRDLAAGGGAVALAVVLVFGGELLARQRKGWPLFGPAPAPPPRKFARRRKAG